MKIDIYTTNPNDLSLFFNDELPADVTRNIASQRGIGTTELFSIVLSFSAGVSSGVLANWIWSHIKKAHGVVKVEVDGKEVELDVNVILTAVLDSIKNNIKERKTNE